MNNKLDPRQYDTDTVKQLAYDMVAHAPEEQSFTGKSYAWIEASTIASWLAKKLEPEWYETTKGAWPGDPFYGKVKRALKALVADGKLVERKGYKVGANVWGNIPRYATPEFAAEFDEQRAAVKATNDAADERFKQSVRTASQFGIEVGGSRHGVILDQESFDHILSVFAEASEAGIEVTYFATHEEAS